MLELRFVCAAYSCLSFAEWAAHIDMRKNIVIRAITIEIFQCEERTLAGINCNKKLALLLREKKGNIYVIFGRISQIPGSYFCCDSVFLYRFSGDSPVSCHARWPAKRDEKGPTLKKMCWKVHFLFLFSIMIFKWSYLMSFSTWSTLKQYFCWDMCQQLRVIACFFASLTK